MTEPVTVLTAAAIHTMDPQVPRAEAIAIRGDRILALGDPQTLLATYPGSRLDERYADRVLLPGFVEAHAHVSGGPMGGPHYLGYFPRMAPDGSMLAGSTSMEQVLANLARFAEQTPPGEPVMARGLDMLFHPGSTLTRSDLDAIASDRAVVVLHASGHVATVSTFVLEAAGLDASTEIVGVVKDDDGVPTGELQELAAMAPAFGVLGTAPLAESRVDDIVDFALDCRNHGVTTATDLASNAIATDEGLAPYQEAAGRDDFPLRLVPFLFAGGRHTVPEATAAAERAVELSGRSAAKLHLGAVKLMLDGSIQQFTASLLEPGYVSGATEGVWNVPPDFFVDQLRPFLQRGVLVHTHCNGDGATEVFVNAMATLLAEAPHPDHRATVTHSQLTTQAQYRRMAQLGMCANVFSNHIWYWGDQHIDFTVGPDRAKRMNAARSALDAGLPAVALHCDSPVTPIDPLATASYAVDRLTPTGRSFGEHERISIPEALHAVTLGPAIMLKLDHLVGSLAPGKYADLAVLDADPYQAPDGATLRDISVLGTVVGGAHFPAPATAAAAPAAPAATH